MGFFIDQQSLRPWWCRSLKGGCTYFGDQCHRLRRQFQLLCCCHLGVQINLSDLRVAVFVIPRFLFLNTTACTDACGTFSCLEIVLLLRNCLERRNQTCGRQQFLSPWGFGWTAWIFPWYQVKKSLTIKVVPFITTLALTSDQKLPKVTASVSKSHYIIFFFQTLCWDG